MAKKILVVGMYGAGNIGDDMILASALQVLKCNGLEDSVSFVSYNPEFHKKEYPQYCIYGVSKREKFKSVAKSDVVLIAGGTACQDALGAGFMRGILYWYIEYLLLAKVLCKKVVFWSIGCDSLTTFWGRMYVRLFGLADKVIVRDERSKGNISIGLNQNKIRVLPDLAYQYNKSKLTIYNKLAYEILKAQQKEIVLVNILEEHIDNSLYKKYLRRLIAEESDILFVFINSEVRVQYDHLSVLSIYDECASIPNNVIYVGTGYYSPAELSELVCLASRVITMRMHFAILAVNRGRKIFMISRSDKTKSFSELNGIKFWDLNDHICYDDFRSRFMLSSVSSGEYLSKINGCDYFDDIRVLL